MVRAPVNHVASVCDSKSTSLPSLVTRATEVKSPSGSAVGALNRGSVVGAL